MTFNHLYIILIITIIINHEGTNSMYSEGAYSVKL